MQQKKIVILGGGESGVGAARLAKQKGFAVFVSDKGRLQDTYRQQLRDAAIDFEEETHTESRIVAADEVIKSPGIPATAPIVQQLKRKGIPIISEIEFAARYTNATLVGITGSNGKTTTTLLTYHLLKSAGLHVGLAGNVGDSFAAQVLDHTFDYYVLELSSFQLDDLYDTHLAIRVLLNITPDHLDRYDHSFEKYTASKFRILQNENPNDVFIYFAESEPIRTELEHRHLIAQPLPISLNPAAPDAPGGRLADGQLVVNANGHTFRISQADTPLRGPHNAINMMAAILVAQTVGISDSDIANGLKTFQNAPHRLEPVGVFKDVTYINDSKATNVDSVYYALASMQTPTIWIAGGLDKGNDYTQLDELARQKVKALVCMGVDNHKLLEHFGARLPVCIETHSMGEAIRQATQLAQPGDTVLLSPACASFDLFKNYQDRGQQFKEAVAALTQPQ